MRTPMIFLISFLLLFPVKGLAGATPLRIAVLGDSLTAGYGLSVEQAFPAQLEVALRQKGYTVIVQNAGVSGDTSAGGLARLDWTLSDRPDLVIIELGANDALRGLDPNQTRENIASILRRIKAAGIKAFLTGMKAPRNLGPEYYTKFDQNYPDLAQSHSVPLYPFFLTGVAGRPELNQQDGLHPTVAGIAVIVKNLLPQILESLESLKIDSPL